jgi:hypothetical protein
MIQVKSRRAHVLVEAVESDTVYRRRGTVVGILRSRVNGREVAGGVLMERRHGSRGEGGR